MSEELKYKLFTPTDCIPEQTMFDYIDNKLSPKEQHAVEKHMLDCELCSDAMEGLRMVKERNRTGMINKKIAERMAAPADKKIVRFNSRVFTSVAAGLVLLIGSVFFFRFFISNNMKDNAVAELKEMSQKETVLTGKDPDSANVPAVPAEDPAPPPPPLTTRSSSTEQIDALEKSGDAMDEFSQELKLEDAETKPNAPEEETSAGRTVSSAITAGNTTTTATPDAVVREENYSYRYTDKSVTDASKANQSNATTIEKAEDQQQIIVNPAPEKDRKRATAKNDEQEYERRILKEQSETKNAAKDKVIGFSTEGKKKEAEKSDRLDERSPATGAGDIVYAPVETKVKNNRVGMTADSISLAGIKANGELFSYEFTTSVDEQPKYPGGDTAMLKFIAKNFQYSGASYKADGLPATKIIAEFTVDKTGVIKNAKIKKGINPTLDKEALRVINAMPKWVPAVKNGKTADAVFTLPIQLDFK